jgi:hypothetical protein
MHIDLKGDAWRSDTSNIVIATMNAIKFDRMMNAHDCYHDWSKE